MARNIITLKALKKMEKREALAVIFEQLGDITNHYFRNCVRSREEQIAMFDMMSDAKNFARYIKRLLKEETNPFPDGFNYVITDLLEKRAEMEDEVRDIYCEVLLRLTKNLTKHLIKEFDMPKEAARELAAIFPGSAVNKHNAWIFNRTLSARLMALQKAYNPRPVVETNNASAVNEAAPLDKIEKIATMPTFNFANAKIIRGLYKIFFGKDEEVLINVYSNLLLDKAEYTRHFDEKQTELWSAISSFAVKGIEKLGYDGAEKVIKIYGNRRARDSERQRDGQRRVVLDNLEYDEYPNIYRVLHPDEFSGKNKKGKKDKKKDSKKDKKKKKSKK